MYVRSAIRSNVFQTKIASAASDQLKQTEIHVSSFLVVSVMSLTRDARASPRLARVLHMKVTPVAVATVQNPRRGPWSRAHYDSLLGPFVARVRFSASILPVFFSFLPNLSLRSGIAPMTIVSTPSPTLAFSFPSFLRRLVGAADTCSARGDRGKGIERSARSGEEKEKKEKGTARRAKKADEKRANERGVSETAAEKKK